MKIAIVDGNNLAFKAYASIKDSRGGLLKNSYGVPTTVIFSLIRTFADLAEKTSFDRIVLCWDITGSYYRRGIFKLYKKHRKYIDMKDYFEELDSAREHFGTFGFNQITAKGIEADDLIGYLAHTFVKQDHKVVVVSDDKDYYQIVKKDVKIWRPIKAEFKTYEDVVDEWDLKPFEIPRAMAITGESGDFIPGVCGIDDKKMELIKCGLGDKTAVKIIKGRKSLTEAIEQWQDNPKAKRQWKPIMLEKKNMIFKSYKLARIRTKIKHYLDWEKELLKDVEVKALEEKKPKIKTVVRLKNYLEFKTINIVYILKKLGIKVQDSVMK